jgi:glycosyltransferase involved in cell wall biosynthesis
MRKVLMISHGYPPVGGSGMLRSLKFSRYLPDHDWRPVVITLRRTKHPRLDPRLLKEVPREAAVYRSPVWNPLDLLLWLRRLAGKLLRRGGGNGNGDEGKSESASPQPGPGADPNGDGLVARVKDFLTFPDGYCGWVFPGCIIGFWTLLRHRPRVIYSTSPPASAHLLGGTLARISGLPWVVDFRDPWTLQFPDEVLKTRRGQRSRRLEGKVLSRAARIICNTEPLARELRDTYPQIDPERFVVITNGYDPADFAADPGEAPAEGPFRFVHTGEFFPVDDMRVPDPFLTALRDLIDEGKVDGDSVRVRLIGSGEYADMEQFHALMSSPTLQKVVEQVDFMPHGDIPVELASSHALLLFQNAPEFRMQVPAKTFEYIRAARPILAVAAPGATADLVASVNGGRTVLPGDDAGIRTAILELLAGRGEPFRRSDEELERFTRPGLTRRLAELLDRVSRSRSRTAVQPTTSRI